MKQAQVLGPSSVRLKCQVRTARNITNDIKLKIAWDMGWRPKQDARTREPSNKGFQNRQEFLKQRQAAWASWEQRRERPPPKDYQKILRIDGVQKAVQAAGRTHKLMQQIVPELSSPWLAEIQKAGENPTEDRERAQTPSTSSRGNMAGSDASGLAPRLPGLGAEEASSPIALGATPMSVPGAIGSSSNHDPPAHRPPTDARNGNDGLMAPPPLTAAGDGSSGNPAPGAILVSVPGGNGSSGNHDPPAPRPPTAARNGNDDLPAPLPPIAAGDSSSGNPAPDGVNTPVWATQLQELPLVQEAQGDCPLPIGQHLLSSGDNDGTGHEEEDYDWAKEADEGMKDKRQAMKDKRQAMEACRKNKAKRKREQVEGSGAKGGDKKRTAAPKTTAKGGGKGTSRGVGKQTRSAGKGGNNSDGGETEDDEEPELDDGSEEPDRENVRAAAKCSGSQRLREAKETQ